jgi:acetoacetate decarboxylase
MADEPRTAPGEVAGRPKLTIRYRTDAAAIEALLPPGLTLDDPPIVTIGVYCVPVLGEPEHGVSIRVPATFDGTSGQYPLGIGIDQEAAIFVSRERNGQPKFPCDVRYFRLGDRVEASATHQGHTFASFAGTLGTADPVLAPADAPEVVEHEWWIKSVRAVGGARGYDYPPHVVDVRTVGRTWRRDVLDGQLTLRSSPWDPVADLLPMHEQLSAELVHTTFSARTITVAGPLDPDGYWPFTDTIGGSRWPGSGGGPR